MGAIFIVPYFLGDIMKKFKFLTLLFIFLLVSFFNIPIFAAYTFYDVESYCPNLTDFQIKRYKQIMWGLNTSTNEQYISFYQPNNGYLYISNDFILNVGISNESGANRGYMVLCNSYYEIRPQASYTSSKSRQFYIAGEFDTTILKPYVIVANSLEKSLSFGYGLPDITVPFVDKWHCIPKPETDPNKVPLPTIDPSKPIEPRPTIVPTPPPSVVGGSDSSNTTINNLDISVRPYIKFIGANGGYLTGGRVDDVEITPEKYLNNRTECQKDSNGNYTCMTLNQDWIIKWPNFPRQNIVLNAMYEVGFDFNFNKYVSGTLEFDFSCGGVNGLIHYSIPLKDVTSYKFVFENSIDGKLLNTDSTDDTVQNNYPNIKNMTITNLLASDGLIVQDNQLNNTIENGNAQSNSSNDKLQGSNTDLDNVITDYDKYDKQFNDDLTASLKNIDFNKFKLDGSGLRNSSAFIRTHFNKISSDNGNPLGLVLGFSMIVGLAVLFIGKKL